MENIGNNVFVTGGQNPTHLPAMLIVKKNSAAERFASNNSFDHLIIGDMNLSMTVDDSDVKWLLRKASGLSVAATDLAEFENVIADTNMDGAFDVRDAIEAESDKNAQ